MRVMIAIDDSLGSQAAIEAVASRNWTAGTEFTVVSIVQLPRIPHIESPFVFKSYADHCGTLVESRRRLVERCCAYLQSKLPDCLTTTLITTGEVRDSLVDICKERAVDLMVLGSTGRKGIDHLFRRSMSWSVVRKLTCSWEIVRVNDDPSDRVTKTSSLFTIWRQDTDGNVLPHAIKRTV